MKKTLLVFAVVFLFLTAWSAQAHQPRLVAGGAPTINVENPEISQAFYSELKGQIQIYEINSDKDFLLYVNLLVPKTPQAKTDFWAVILKDEPGQAQWLGELDGTKFKWQEFYEKFAGDNYLKGPEFEKQVPAGKYFVRVLSFNSNQGKYVLAIGKEEKFPLKEILNTIKLLPALKKDFFGKSPLTAYFNLTGLFLLGCLVVLTGIIFGLWLILRKRKTKTYRENVNLPPTP